MTGPWLELGHTEALGSFVMMDQLEQEQQLEKELRAAFGNLTEPMEEHELSRVVAVCKTAAGNGKQGVVVQRGWERNDAGEKVWTRFVVAMSPEVPPYELRYFHGPVASRV